MPLTARGSAGRPHVAFVLPGLQAGGAERVVSLLAGQFVRDGLATTVVTFEDGATYYSLDPLVRCERLPIRFTGRLNGVLQPVRRIAALRRFLLRERPDVVIAFLTKTNVISLLAAAGTGIPVIVSERNNPDEQYFHPLWRRLVAATYPRSAGVVTMTAGALAHFPPRQRPRGTVIPNPVGAVPDAVRRADGRALVAVGRLDPQKGFDLLLDAFARVAAAAPDWRLVIFGDGPMRGELEAQRDRLGLAGRVSLPGLSGTPGQWIEEADVFVFSSRFEGWGNVLAEAAAAGLPIVTFACLHGPAEIVRHGREGLLVPPGDVAALAAALQRVLTDTDLRASLGRHGAEFRAAHQLAPIAARWRALIEAALADRAPDRAAAPAIEGSAAR